MPTKNNLSSEKARNKAAWISAVASAIILALKVIAYRATGSAAVLSDALESIVNVVASLVALFVIRFASQPADEEHPYGHGKAEYFSAAFEGGLIFFAALMIIGESIKSLIFQEPTQQLEVGLAIVGFAALINLALGLYLKHIGKTHLSDALSASGAHVLSDVYTTFGIMLGLVMVMITGYTWLDPIIAILVGAHLAYSGFKIVMESWGGLLDGVDTKALENLASSMEKSRQPGIIDIHHLRVIRAGSFHHVDAHIVIPEYWDVLTAHTKTHEFEDLVVQEYLFEGEIAFHIDPCKKSFCEICSVENCPIRQVPFKALRPFSVKSLTNGPVETNQGTYDKQSAVHEK